MFAITWPRRVIGHVVSPGFAASRLRALPCHAPFSTLESVSDRENRDQSTWMASHSMTATVSMLTNAAKPKMPDNPAMRDTMTPTGMRQPSLWIVVIAGTKQKAT